MDNTYVYMVGLPDSVNEMVLPCADGFTVYINEKLDDEKKLQAYCHALEHIKNNDWNNSDVQMIEAKAHENGG